MGQFIDLTGQKFARITILERDLSVGPASRGKKVQWRCRCDCGTEFVALGKNIVNSVTKSCGCLKKDVHRKLFTTHGMTKTRTYRIWQSMIARCEYPSHATYRFYGAKGIRICQRWRVSFEAFLEDMGEAPSDMSLDRIDVHGHYKPSNCRWADDATQHANRKNVIEWRGERMPRAELARRVGVPRTSLNKLLVRGLSVEAAVAHALAHRK
jgi:hypothetical protein